MNQSASNVAGAIAPWERSDYEIRQTALYQACHDFKGGADEKEVVARAQAYYEFLKGGEEGAQADPRLVQMAGAVAR